MRDPSDLLKRAGDLARHAAELIDTGRLDEAQAVQRDAERALRTARRALAGQARSARVSGSPSSQTGREVVVESLAELEVPASPRLVSAYAMARFGAELKPSGFASTRRDERRAWSSPRAGRAVYIVPALDASRLTPVRGLLTLSDWDLARRVVGPRSARVDHLRATRAVARHFSWLAKGAADDQSQSVERMARLLADLSRTLPGVGEGWATPESELVVGAVEAELALLEEDDRELRLAAAERARGQLSAQQQLWGAAALDAVADVKDS